MSPIETKHNNNSNNSTKSSSSRVKFRQILQHSIEEDNNIDQDINHYYYNSSNNYNYNYSSSSSSSPRVSNIDENYYSSPLPNTFTSSPYLKSPWIKLSPLPNTTPLLHHPNQNLQFIRGRKCLIGSLFREEGHVYSLAVRNRVLYTGSESKNIRVWKDFHDSGGFKSKSGLVKAIVTSKDDKVFTGHQDGKIRIWNPDGKRVGTLPRFKDYVKSSMNPKSYVEVRRHHKVNKIKHFDAVSCMSLNEEFGLLYSGSWDKTIKVWRIYDGRCLESIDAHNDAINSVVVGYDGLIFSGSADGSVKVWRRELDGENVRHFLVKTLLKQANAVTALAVTTDDLEEGNGWVLYGGSSDGLVNFWEKDEEEGVVYGGVLRGHKLAVLCLASVGSLVFSGSADKMICVWKREEDGVHSCLAVLSGHLGPIKCLAVELDDDSNYNHNDDHDRDRDYDDDDDDDEKDRRKDWIVYSGSLDKSVKIWRVSEHTLEDESSYDVY